MCGWLFWCWSGGWGGGWGGWWGGGGWGGGGGRSGGREQLRDLISQAFVVRAVVAASLFRQQRLKDEPCRFNLAAHVSLVERRREGDFVHRQIDVHVKQQTHDAGWKQSRNAGVAAESQHLRPERAARLHTVFDRSAAAASQRRTPGSFFTRTTTRAEQARSSSVCPGRFGIRRGSRSTKHS